MRRFELVLLFASAFAVLWPVVFGVRPRRGLVAFALSASLFVQLQFEGFRWQMLPLYVVGVGLAVGDVFFLDRAFEWPNRLLRGFLGSVGLVVVGALPFALPVPDIPTPAGPQPIGTLNVQLVDRARDEPYGENPGGLREIMTQVWYPAVDEGDGTRVAWSQDWEEVAPAIAREMGLPSWFWNHTQYSLSHAAISAEMGTGPFPVVIFSHGWGGVRTGTLSQIQDLASNGYIVVGIDHPHIAAATVLDDGEVVSRDPGALPDPEVDETAYAEAVNAMVATQAGDIVSVLNALEAGESGPFAEVAPAADLSRIGIYGHATGGTAAIKVCLEDERCQALLTMDPWVEALTERDLRLTMTRPALYMRSEDWIGTTDDALLRGIAARGEAVTYMIGIDGAATTDFLMIPLLTPLADQFGWKGPIGAGRVITIVDNYLLGFFDVFLLGTGSAQLDSVSFEEVDVSVVDPGG